MMKFLKNSNYIALVSFLVAGSVLAVPQIDQNQPNGLLSLAAFSQSNLAQSFQQANGNIAGAGIFLYAEAGSADTVTIAVWDALPNQSGAKVLASGSGNGTQGSWFDVFWNPVSITPGSTYYLVFSGNTSLTIAGDANPYPNGQAYANAGFTGFPDYDYKFRTYYDDSFAGVEVSDAGSTVVILGMSLAGICFVRARMKVL